MWGTVIVEENEPVLWYEVDDAVTALRDDFRAELNHEIQQLRADLECAIERLEQTLDDLQGQLDATD
jgi:hypothetical protein